MGNDGSYSITGSTPAVNLSFLGATRSVKIRLISLLLLSVPSGLLLSAFFRALGTDAGPASDFHAIETS
jgi:hypothetical protein